MSKHAVFMDYELNGKRNTVVLGGSIGERDDSRTFLSDMCCYSAGYDQRRAIWEVDEDSLPWGYKFQTYYVAPYQDDQLMIGVA